MEDTLLDFRLVFTTSGLNVDAEDGVRSRTPLVHARLANMPLALAAELGWVWFDLIHFTAKI